MDKKNAPTQKSQSTNSQRQFSTRDEAFKKKMFPEEAHNCFECEKRLTKSNRKRMVTFHPAPGGTIASAHQLCKKCAAFLHNQDFYRVPKVHKDILSARFTAFGAHAGCVGGLQ